MFWGSSDQISGFHGNQNFQKTYNRENVVVRTVAPSFLIGSSSNLPETILQDMHKISDVFDFRPHRTFRFGVTLP